MKKFAAVFLSLFLLCSFAITANAQSTVISTSVPGFHTLTVDSDGAEVFCGGVTDKEFEIERLSDPTLLFRAQSGKAIKQVTVNGEDITSQIKGGYYTLAPVYEDKTIRVITENEQKPDPESKTYTVTGIITRNGEPVKGITLELRSELKIDISGSDGRFSFEDVPCGKHSLTALENGAVVGYIEFELAEGTETEFHITDSGLHKITVDKNEIGIDLALRLNEDGTMKLESVTGIDDDSKDKSGTEFRSPMTGDGNWIFVFFILMLISLVAVVVLTATYSRRKDNE